MIKKIMPGDKFWVFEASIGGKLRLVEKTCSSFTISKASDEIYMMIESKEEGSGYEVYDGKHCFIYNSTEAAYIQEALWIAQHGYTMMNKKEVK